MICLLQESSESENVANKLLPIKHCVKMRRRRGSRNEVLWLNQKWSLFQLEISQIQSHHFFYPKNLTKFSKKSLFPPFFNDLHDTIAYYLSNP